MVKSINEIKSLIHRLGAHMTLAESEEYTENQLPNDLEIITCFRGDENWEDYVTPNINNIWDFLVKAYRGDFKGCQSRNDLKKNASAVRIVKMGDIWIALSIYTSYKGGYKCVGIGGITDSQYRKFGKLGVQKLIREDIGDFDNFYWCEK